ncbi:MAG: hypothetical protein DMG49_07125 [Acidobacteria bacterium]|nr:MAG: hypothetical protein DMG49_07125 [Acidobacteriota bacterium]
MYLPGIQFPTQIFGDLVHIEGKPDLTIACVGARQGIAELTTVIAGDPRATGLSKACDIFSKPEECLRFRQFTCQPKSDH